MKTRCIVCRKRFDSFYIFEYAEDKYCINCLKDKYNKMKKPVFFIETVSDGIINNIPTKVRGLSLVTLSRKGTSLFIQSHTEPVNNIINKETLSFEYGIMTVNSVSQNVGDYIKENNLYEKLLKEKERLENTKI